MTDIRPVMVLCCISLLSVIGVHSVFAESKTTIYTDKRHYVRAKITGIEKSGLKGETSRTLVETRVHLLILDGEYKGQTRTAVFKGEDDMPREMVYRAGDTVFAGIAAGAMADSIGNISLYDTDNSTGIIIMGVLLLAVVIVIGRLKGFFALVSLLITIMLLFLVLMPMTLKGYSPLPIAVLISIVSIVLTLPIIAGLRLKTLAAVLGASAGVVFSALLALIFGWTLHLSGIVTNEMLTVFYAADVAIDLRGLALSGMIIAALGAVMDVCISIASSTAEIYAANPNIPSGEAFRSVLNIGTDIMGSMVNTLILAYAGSSLSLILLISMRFTADMPLWMVFNYNPVLSEIVKSVVGSVGMFLCIPLTAFIAVRLYAGRISSKREI